MLTNRPEAETLFAGHNRKIRSSNLLRFASRPRKKNAKLLSLQSCYIVENGNLGEKRRLHRAEPSKGSRHNLAEQNRGTGPASGSSPLTMRPADY